MNLLSLLPGALKIAAKFIGGSVLGDAAKVLESAQVSPEQRAAMEAELHDHEFKMRGLDADVAKAALATETAMVQSEDSYTKRARPTAVYGAVLLTGFVVSTICVMWLRKLAIDWAVVAAITSLISPMWGAVGYYFGQRTKEKLGAN